MEHVQETTNYWILKQNESKSSSYVRVTKSNSDKVHWCLGNRREWGVALLGIELPTEFCEELENEFQQELLKNK